MFDILFVESYRRSNHHLQITVHIDFVSSSRVSAFH